MALVKAICTHCGGVLDVDNEKDAWVCKYCNTPFIVEKAVNIYNTNTTVKAEHVDYYGGKASMEELIQRADAFLVVKDYAKLQNVYEEMTESYPTRYEGWWGMITIITEDFTDFRILGKDAVDKLEKTSRMMKLCKQYAPSDVYSDMEAKYTLYLNKYKEIILKNETNKCNETIKSIQDTIVNSYHYHLRSLENQAETYKSNIKKEKKILRSRNYNIIWLLVFIVATIISFANEVAWLGVILLFFVFFLLLDLKKSYSSSKRSSKSIADSKKWLREYETLRNQPFRQPDLENRQIAAQQELAQLEQRLNSIQ